MKSTVAALGAVLITSVPGVAYAGSTTTTMAVTATVVSTCTVVAAPLAFGQLSITGADNDTQTNITLTCTPGITYNVGLDNGAHAANGVRNMAATLGGTTVPYRIYSNAARTVEWGNTVGTNTVGGTIAAAVTTLTAYGRVSGSATLLPAGGYTDAVTVTLTF